ncbi:MAG: MFS transporter [Bacteroidota bacterium]
MTDFAPPEEAVQTDAATTQFDKLRAIPWSLGYDLANTFFVQLTFFGSVFILFLDDLGLGTSQIGLLLSLMPFLSILSVFITPSVTRLGYKRTFLVSLALRNLFTAGLLVVPLLAARLSPGGLIGFIALITIAFAISRAVAMTAFLPWQREYLPDQWRGRVSGYSSIIISLAGLLAVGLAGYLMDRPLGEWRYPLLFGIGVSFGLASVFIASRFPGGGPSAEKRPLLLVGRNLLAPLRDPRFVRYLIVLGLVTLSMGPIFSFLPIFMRQKVGLHPGSIVFLQTGALIGSLLSSYFWGWLADRYGSRPIALSGLLLTVSLPLLWFVMPRGSPVSFVIALGISLLQGIAGSGWAIGSGRLLFVSIATGEGSTEYLSQYNAWTGLLSGVGSILGGVLLQSLSAYRGTVFNVNLDAYSILFATGFGLCLLGVLFLRAIQAPREASLGELAGLFLHGNPLTAISSVIRFYYAREESDVIAMTERLGNARSPLTVDELIASLEDPRFYVRFEAIVSISRHSTDDRLVEALIDVMEAPDPALSVAAAWALGRIGNLNALPALRRSLAQAQYRSLKAHAARALGTLGDSESIPLLLNYVQHEADLGLRVACASSIGKLAVTDAAPDLLQLLYGAPFAQSRREVGLALARLLKAQDRYIKLTRTLDEDPGTGLAQEMEIVRRAMGRAFPLEEETLSSLLNARERFAHQDLSSGMQALSGAIDSIDGENFEPFCRQILAESALRMQEFGPSRLEYPILASLILEAC